ncbi:hypothetical protein [Scrofimicrobium sp. R131]|uniref:Uncharacterized protein n=1 Tax=Scrofimicrobium appendicitidis TaxID=3079930 RepID=A0AAU7V7Z3_9ACTO
MEARRFRRPAMLDPKEAEEIMGDGDPAEEAEIAHTSAWALMGVPEGDFDQEHVDRLVEVVQSQGVDAIAGLWDRSSEITLAGALWRLYLLWQWHQLDPATVDERFDEGREALLAQGETPDSIPPLGDVLRGLEIVLGGRASEDQLSPVLEVAARTLEVMAAGVSAGPRWIESDEHELAHPVTRRPRALLDTAQELRESARQARQGTLG